MYAHVSRECTYPPKVSPSSCSKLTPKPCSVPDSPDRLQPLRTSLRDRLRLSPVNDVTAFARNMENAYRAMWQWWCERKEP